MRWRTGRVVTVADLETKVTPVDVPPLTTSTGGSGDGRFWDTLQVYSSGCDEDRATACVQCGELADCGSSPREHLYCARDNVDDDDCPHECRDRAQEALISINLALESACPFNPQSPPRMCSDLPANCIAALRKQRPLFEAKRMGCECEGFFEGFGLVFKLCLDPIDNGGALCGVNSSGKTQDALPGQPDVGGAPNDNDGRNKGNSPQASTATACTVSILLSVLLAMLAF